MQFSETVRKNIQKEATEMKKNLKQFHKDENLAGWIKA